MRKNKRPVTAFAKKSCVTATQVALAMMAAPLVYAQQAEVQKGERIEITGTRIPSPNLESTSPVAVIGAEDIKFEGVRNVENLLNNMPQVFAAQGSSISNGSSGTATVNLRGIGDVRTLVLVNGKRLPAGDPNVGGTAPDLNQIPVPLIQRVEILTGGASAVYGSDAIAGVVNFILRDNFEGVQGQVNYSWYQHDQHNPQNVQQLLTTRAASNPAQFAVPGDKGSLGESTDASLTLGGNFAGGKGNATLFWGYKKDQAILQKDYDYSECSFGSSRTGFTCGGSGTSFPGEFIAVTGAGRVFTIADAAGHTRAFSSATDQFNFAPYNYYQRPSERYTFHASGHYDINPHARAYLDFGFHDDHTVAQIAPSGLFGVDIVVSGDNPLLSNDFLNELGMTRSASSTGEFVILRRNIEGGGRQDDIRHTSFRAVGGVKGDVFKNWDYDIYAQTAKVLYQEIYRNDFSISRGALALDVVTDPSTGLPVCRSTLTGSTASTPVLQGCVPYNIFQIGGVTPAALNYVSTPGFKKGFTSQTIQGATLSGDLGNYGWKMPGAKSGIGVAAGVERRVEKLQLLTDVEFDTGDLAGQGGPTHGVEGQFTVKEAFGEIRVPILEGRHMADLLSVNASYRYSDYNLGFTTDTYGIGLDFAPVKAVKFRGSYQKATRAPNVIELFTPQGIALFDLSVDPCGVGGTATQQQCAATGLPANLYHAAILNSPAQQYNYLQGGNPNLQPENAKTYTAGLVLQPLRNLSATIDYYQIKIDDVISNFDPVTVLQTCISTGSFCNLIHRDRFGTLWLQPSGFISSTNINLSKLKTSGWDLAVNYNYGIGRWGGLGFNFQGTYLEKFVIENIPGLGDFDCVGLYRNGCGTPNPQWRHRLRTTWNSPWNLDLAATWRHFGKVDWAGLSDNPLLHSPTNPVNEHLGERDYLDLAASWAYSKTITVVGGVNNLFDRDPPLTALAGAGFGNGNTFPQVYDALGRKFFVGVTVRY